MKFTSKTPAQIFSSQKELSQILTENLKTYIQSRDTGVEALVCLTEVKSENRTWILQSPISFNPYIQQRPFWRQSHYRQLPLVDDKSCGFEINCRWVHRNLRTQPEDLILNYPLTLPKPPSVPFRGRITNRDVCISMMLGGVYCKFNKARQCTTEILATTPGC